MGCIEFDPTRNLIFLDLGVVSSDGLWTFYIPVVMDTGATTSILPADILVDLGYDPGAPGLPRKRIITGSGVEYAPSLTVRGLIIGREKLSEIEVLCHDLPEEAGIDGLLGMNFLKHFDFTVENSSGLLHFRPLI